jgi:hypothetical protein
MVISFIVSDPSTPFILLSPVSREGNITILVTGTYTSRVRYLYSVPGAPLPLTRKNILLSWGGKHRTWEQCRMRWFRFEFDRLKERKFQCKQMSMEIHIRVCIDLISMDPCIVLKFIQKNPKRCNSLSKFNIPYLHKALQVSGDTSPIIRSLKLH